MLKQYLPTLDFEQAHCTMCLLHIMAISVSMLASVLA